MIDPSYTAFVVALFHCPAVDVQHVGHPEMCIRRQIIRSSAVDKPPNQLVYLIYFYVSEL